MKNYIFAICVVVSENAVESKLNMDDAAIFNPVNT